jgi:hypothetical protein
MAVVRRVEDGLPKNAALPPLPLSPPKPAGNRNDRQVGVHVITSCWHERCASGNCGNAVHLIVRK